ncbi:hypothetical protein BKA61DRAFT_707367 [Leptodontidium sp. MPI-SDFR-AT-0119]|nr:hypothetical protein BKA61DRAFT_707367 [Leptodontidium sp. MPI-SDFR-AT-0119]
MPPKKVNRLDLLGVLDEVAEEPGRGPGPQKVVPPTERMRLLLWNAWKTFLRELRTDFPDHHLFRDGTEDATESRVKAFFFWYAASYTRDVKDRPTVESMDQYVWVFGMANNERSQYKISKDTIDRIKEYVRTVVAEKAGLCDKHKPKKMATLKDVSILLRHMWNEKEYTFNNERYRVQLALFMKLLVYSTSRPGAIAISDGYRGTNESMTYGDMKVQLLRDITGDETSRPEIMITVRFNLLKNKRQKTGEFTEVTIKENRSDPVLCPILDFLALADADGAWKHFASSKDLYAYRLPSGRDNLEVPFKDEICSLPFLRRTEPWGTTLSSNLAWKCGSINKALKQLSLRAGMRYHVTPYDIRRASANVLHMIASGAELSKQLGHSRAATFQKYLSSHMRIDLQGLCTNGVARQDHIDSLRSMSLSMRPGAPLQIPESMKEEVRKNQEYLDLIQIRDNLSVEINQWLEKNSIARVRYPSSFRTKQDADAAMATILLQGGPNMEVPRFSRPLAELVKAARAAKNYHARMISRKTRLFREEWFNEETRKDSAYVEANGDHDHELSHDASTPDSSEEIHPRAPLLAYYSPAENSNAILDVEKGSNIIELLSLVCHNDPRLRCQNLVTDSQKNEGRWQLEDGCWVWDATCRLFQHGIVEEGRLVTTIDYKDASVINRTPMRPSQKSTPKHLSQKLKARSQKPEGSCSQESAATTSQKRKGPLLEAGASAWKRSKNYYEEHPATVAAELVLDPGTGIEKWQDV